MHIDVEQIDDIAGWFLCLIVMRRRFIKLWNDGRNFNMKFGKGNQIEEYIQSMSKLEQADYQKAGEEVADFYERLLNNRKNFQIVLQKNISALMQISALDLTLNHYTDKLMDVCNSLADATKTIHSSSKDTAQIATSVQEQHEELTNTIIAVSEESENVCKKIEEGQKELTQIRNLSSNTISSSEEMHNDMDKLSNVINRMNEVIEDINSISSQTNLLSLNASIEAARAGEAGKGFAVVADEIRNLAEETQQLTGNMGQFVEGVRNASRKSVESVANTIHSLQSMTKLINNVWSLNEENQGHVAKITDSISSLAAVSEEISSSMTILESQAGNIQNKCHILEEDAVVLQQIGDATQSAVKPVEVIESELDAAVKVLGVMSKDSLMNIEKDEFSSYIDKAIDAHEKWLENLHKIVTTNMIMPLQIDDSKCGFGHFYYSVTPQYVEIMEIWKELGKKHKNFHQYGSKIIQALFEENAAKAEELYKEAENYSKELISDLRAVKTALRK